MKFPLDDYQNLRKWATSKSKITEQVGFIMPKLLSATSITNTMHAQSKRRQKRWLNGFLPIKFTAVNELILENANG